MPSEQKNQIHLLLVDDENVLLNSIRRRLQLRNFNVITANQGEDALAAARDYAIDVVVLDLKMPGMSGREVLTEMKNRYPWLEVIILTGHGAFNPNEDSAFDCAYDCLAKPCDLDTLIETIAAAANKTRMNRKRDDY